MEDLNGLCKVLPFVLWERVRERVFHQLKCTSSGEGSQCILRWRAKGLVQGSASVVFYLQPLAWLYGIGGERDKTKYLNKEKNIHVGVKIKWRCKTGVLGSQKLDSQTLPHTSCLGKVRGYLLFPEIYFREICHIGSHLLLHLYFSRMCS